MSLKFITNKTYLENVNGLKNFEEFNINYDSNRDKNKQVKASFNKNGKKYEVEDSLQKFMNTMPHSKNSIFDLLKNDLRELKKKTNNLSQPTKYIKLKNGNMNGTVSRKNVSRKSSKGKYRINRGITSKLFDYDQQLLPQDYNHKIHITNKHKLKHAKKYTHRAK